MGAGGMDTALFWARRGQRTIGKVNRQREKPEMPPWGEEETTGSYHREEMEFTWNLNKWANQLHPLASGAPTPSGVLPAF